MIKFSHALRLAAGNLRSARVRSGLTALGIIIGIAAVVTNLSLGASFNAHFINDVMSAGSNYIFIGGKQSNLFHDNELEVIKNTRGIEGVSPLKYGRGDITFRTQVKSSVSVKGVSGDYLEIQNLQMESGSFLKDKDGYVAVLGHKFANEFFDKKVSNRNTLEITFHLDDGTVVTKKFKVKGIIRSTEETLSGIYDNVDYGLYIPVGTLNEIQNENDYGNVFAMAARPEIVEEASDEIDERLSRCFGIPKRDLDNEDAKPYHITDQADLLGNVNEIMVALNMFLLSIALVSLAVGTIGIMNIMLVTVTERTVEIGVLKSLGYSNPNVIMLFLVESVLLSLFGGIFGTGLGISVALIIEKLIVLPHVFPVTVILAGVGVAVFVGLLAGVYPARKAAKLNPVDALRYQ